MPTYQYACTACDERLEAVQSFSDAPLTECPTCGGALRKVFSAVGVVFKGSGFYKTDSRSGGAKGEGAKAEGASSDGAKSDSAKSDSAKSDSAKSDGAKSDGAKGSGAAASTSGSSAPAAAAASKTA